jgi:hypothetical protein
VVFGVVSMPTNGRFYTGGAGLGAWRGDKGGSPVAIQVRDAPRPVKRLPWWPAVAIPALSRNVCWPV